MPKNIPFVPADDLSKLWRAIIEFDMLAPGDRILVGLSGQSIMMYIHMIVVIQPMREVT